jgi:hypothetical protein
MVRGEGNKTNTEQKLPLQITAGKGGGNKVKSLGAEGGGSIAV